VVELFFATDNDNAQESSSNADGPGANKEEFVVQLFQAIRRSVQVDTIRFSNCTFGQLPLLFLSIISLSRSRPQIFICCMFSIVTYPTSFLKPTKSVLLLVS